MEIRKRARSEANARFSLGNIGESPDATAAPEPLGQD
jgi:hypothetical protein